MYYKRKSDVIYRNYDSFGYITDNRNFEYKLTDGYEKNIGDRIVSGSGAVFLSALSRVPQNIDDVCEKISTQFIDADFKILKRDAIEFYNILESDGFVVSGKTIEECNDKDQVFSYKKNKMQLKEYVQKSECSISAQDFFEKYFNGKPLLTSVHIEIISVCNERCIHCYIPHEKKTEIMTPDMFFNILEQCREMNVLHLTISGGEPMAHNNFIDFLRKCNEYNFSVNVLSNLTLLNQDMIMEMKNNPLLCVQTSLYSMNSDVHDAITQIKGSFEKTKASILMLIENDIPVQISCPIMKHNMECYDEVINWGRDHNMNVNSDFVLIAGYDHTTNNLQCRLSLDDVSKIVGKNIDSSTTYLKSIEENILKKKNQMPDDHICSVCRSSICISEKGNVYPCVGWQDCILGNIDTTQLVDIWENSEKVQYLRNLRRFDFPKCLECSDNEFCTMCMVRNANEDPLGDPLAQNIYYCNIAKINKEMYFSRIQNPNKQRII